MSNVLVGFFLELRNRIQGDRACSKQDFPNCITIWQRKGRKRNCFVLGLACDCPTISIAMFIIGHKSLENKPSRSLGKFLNLRET